MSVTTMPPMKVSLEYLQKLDIYNHEKPYWMYLSPQQVLDTDTEYFSNLSFERFEGINIHNLRQLQSKADINECGFQVMHHSTKISQFDCLEDIQKYKEETEKLLENTLGTVHVKCYDITLRKNVVFERSQVDLADPLHLEGPARGVHNDVTYESARKIIMQYLSNESKSEFLKAGYRVRIINTWRPLVPVLEDRPLALCDSRSVSPDDLIAADRVMPGHVGEVYYLTHNSNHKWFWLEKQTPSEPFAFVMYDTKAGNHAQFCPHVSFDNPNAAVGAVPRESVETRSIVITTEDS